MLAYKFRVSFEDQDDFLREIELRSDHTFEDFHNAIVGNLGLDAATLSSFFLCDHNFRKKKEISLIDMKSEDHSDPDPDDDDIPVPPKTLVGIMKDSMLCDFIDDPHQRLMYVYDYINYWTFYIEMVKIVPADSKVTYPRVTRSIGPVPREFTATPQQIPGVDKSLEFGFQEEAYDPEDIKRLDGDEDFFEDQEDESNDSLDQEQF